jgi:hypothetical protein
VVSFTPRLFTPGERAPGTQWKGSWVCPRTGLDDVEKRKFLTLPGLKLRPLCRRYTDGAIPTPILGSSTKICFHILMFIIIGEQRTLNMKRYMRICAHLERNSLNIYRTEKIIQRELKHTLRPIHFFVSFFKIIINGRLQTSRSC